MFNNITWTLYAIEVLGSINTAANVFFFLSCAVLAFTGFICMIACEDLTTKDSKGKEQWTHMATVAGRVARVCIIIGCVSLPIALLIPSRTTMAMMALSQVGEVIATTDVAKEVATDALNALKGYLKDAAKPAK